MSITLALYNILQQVLAVWVFQVVFCVLIFMSVLEETQQSFENVPSMNLSMCRFVAGVLMQMIVNHEIQNGLIKMKYCVNHSWKFRFGYLAYMSGLFQVISGVLIAIVNYNVIFASLDVLDLAKDFTALMILVTIDNEFASLSQQKNIKSALEDPEYADIFKVQTTTSVDAYKEANEALEEDKVLVEVNKRIEHENAQVRTLERESKEIKEKKKKGEELS